MNDKMYDSVLDFNTKFNLPTPDEPTLISFEDMSYRLRFLKEELAEAEEAMLCQDMEAIAKELADLVYVAIGTAIWYGIPFEQVYDAVHAANMTKTRATNPSESKRSSAWDVIKGNSYRSAKEPITEIFDEFR